jgi:D-alanyl-D-alanine carboxypeptidase/D-alanyl-D-alanine-endopeptidase (penicillin-binding protein 4)
MAPPARARLRAADRRRRALVVAGAASGALLLLAAAGPPWARSAPRPPTVRAAATPVWSLRRAPAPVGDALAAQRLGGRLATEAAGVQHCHLVADAGGVVSAAAPRELLVPASTMKLVTAAAVLEALGPGSRLTTRAVAAGPVDSAGRVARIWLVGGGDPVLVSPEGEAARDRDPRTRGLARSRLSDLADALVTAGVRSVPGGVTGDGGRYPNEPWPPAWPDRHRRSAVSGPVAALAVDDGLGGPGGTGPPAGADPAAQAAAQLARLLQARGVRVGPPGSGPAPAGAVTLARLRSAPLAELVTQMLAASDNRTAEVLLRELALSRGEPATTAGGLAAARRVLIPLGLGAATHGMVDGSGLAPTNRLRCRDLLQVLEVADGSGRLGAVHDGLAVAGVRGTLATSFVGTPLAGRLWAKTGTLDGVSGLAGDLRGARPLRFALLLNGAFPETVGVARRERMAAAIAAFPGADDPAGWVPTPRGTRPGA